MSVNQIAAHMKWTEMLKALNDSQYQQELLEQVSSTVVQDIGKIPALSFSHPKGSKHPPGLNS